MFEDFYMWVGVFLLDALSTIMLYLFFNSLFENQMNFNDSVISRINKYEAGLANSAEELIDDNQYTLDTYLEEE